MNKLLYFPAEMAEDEAFFDWVKTVENSICVEAVESEENLREPEQSLLLAKTGKSVEWAKRNDIAVVGYQPTGIHEFLRVNYVIEGFEDLDREYLELVYRRQKGIPWMVFKTKRCIVRELCLDDLDALFKLYENIPDEGFLEPLYPYEEEKEYEKAYIANMYGYFGYGMWLVIDKASGKIIGRAGLEHRDYGQCSELEMGYMLDKDFWHKGYATEVCSAIMEFARENTDFPRINCLIHEENRPSIRLMERLGFSFLEMSEVTGERLRRYIYELDR